MDKITIVFSFFDEREAGRAEKRNKTEEASLLGKDWGERWERYDFLVVGSGYGAERDGLFAADGSLVPTSPGVNPFQTISALTKTIAERLVRNLRGEIYPAPKAPVSVPVFDYTEALRSKEPELERIFSRVETRGMETMVNRGETSFDLKKGLIRNDKAFCRVSGYSENVYVWASATDGWFRSSRYDDHGVRAFVLAPQQEEEP